MKLITEREEIAKVMNFGKYPVLVLDMDNHCGFENTAYCKGQKVRVAWDRPEKRYEGMTAEGNIYMDEDLEIKISNNGAMLKTSFGYSDIMEMADWANAPVVHRGQTVVVIMSYGSARGCVVRMMKVSDRIDIHCQTVASLEDIED